MSAASGAPATNSYGVARDRAAARRVTELIEENVLQREEQEQVLEELLEQQQQQQGRLTTLGDQLQLMREQRRDLEQQKQAVQYNHTLTQARVDELIRSQQQAEALEQRAQIELAGLVDDYESMDLNELHDLCKRL